MELELSALLASTKLFADADEDTLNWLCKRAALRHVMRGEEVLTAGAPSDHMLVVVSGRFAVRIPGHAAALSEIGASETIGEMGVLTGEPRAATVTAIRDSLVIAIDAAVVDEALDRSRAARRSMFAMLAGRLREAGLRAGPPQSTQPRAVALAPLGDFDAAAFAERLVAALRRCCNPLLITASSALAGSGAASVADPDVTTWLNNQERGHDLLIYVTRARLDAWSETCLRQVDEVLLLGAAGAAPAQGPVDQRAMALTSQQNRRLVLVHSRRAGAVAGTAPWLDRWPVRRHHHVCLADDDDLAALARFLTGSAVGFVAAGGGAFGPAHIGVWRALASRGVAVDVVGGSSIGSAMTAGFACLEQPERMESILAEVFVQKGVLKRYTWPRYALIDHVGLDQALQGLYGDTVIEDIWKPYFAVAMNLSTNRSEVIDRGPLWKAIRASCAIPGVMMPMPSATGDILVDGGLINNVPVDVMRMHKTGPNIVVTFRTDRPEPVTIEYDKIPGRIALFWRSLPLARALGLAPPPLLPGPLAVMFRSLFRADQEDHLPTGPDDLLLTLPPFPGSSLLDWSRHREVAAAAHDWAQATFARLDEEGSPAWRAVLRASAAPRGAAAT
jgi:NTE family protein